MLLRAALLDSLPETQEESMEVRYSIKCLYVSAVFHTHSLLTYKTRSMLLNCSSNLGLKRSCLPLCWEPKASLFLKSLC